MESISRGQPFRVIVDYAHTPQSFAKLLSLAREHTEGRLIAVFGSAGERDLEKRPLQGEVAVRYSDIVILTDEDPRDEEPSAILEQIAAGCRREKPGLRTGVQLFLIPDRREAITRALSLAEKGDTVLLLGKGHERSIIYADGPIPWLEAQVAREILEQMGWKP
jgi:UDP-N-acetylmuramoyl-L-alanyl-D-glutamate--2,6-diaminopimelate ligase